MERVKRLKPATIAAIAVLVIAVGSAFAVGQPTTPRSPLLADESAEPQEQQDEAPPTEEDVAHAVERLQAKGFSTDAAALAALAAEHGVGGAVRLVAWADETGMSVDELVAMRADGMGWGQMARELDVHPGLGSIMGNGGGNGNGLGREGAPGQQKQDDAAS
jgi:hypothetical protein